MTVKSERSLSDACQPRPQKSVGCSSAHKGQEPGAPRLQQKRAPQLGRMSALPPSTFLFQSGPQRVGSEALGKANSFTQF